MFNQKLLKAMLLGSWALVVYAATPWAGQPIITLSAIVIGLTYALAGLVNGFTDKETKDQIQGMRDDLREEMQYQAEQVEALHKMSTEVLEKCKAETGRISKAISEMRSLDR